MRETLRKFDCWLKNPQSLGTSWPWAYRKIYNFSWHHWTYLFDNRMSRMALLFSGVGYLILLNDYFAPQINFDEITEGTGSYLSLSSNSKLRMLYFGSLLIALSRIIFLAKRPRAIEFGPDLAGWVRYGFSEFTYFDFKNLHDDIDLHGHRTLYGKYYTDDWDAFSEDARWKESGKTAPDDQPTKQKSRETVNFRAAKERHEDLLRSILVDRYYEFSASRKIALLFAIAFGVVGFGIFFLPALDLFLTVLSGTFLHSP